MLEQPPTTSLTGRHLGAEIAHHQLGSAYVGGKQVLKGTTEQIIQWQLHGGDNQTFLDQMGGLGVQGRSAANIGVVTNGAGKSNQTDVIEHRQKQQNIVQMLAVVIGVIGNERLVGPNCGYIKIFRGDSRMLRPES